MSDEQFYIIKQFSDKNHTITRLMEEDPEFLALCEDYHLCVEALRYWEQSKEPEAETRVDEYRTLVQELEEEIAQALVDLEPRRLD